MRPTFLVAEPEPQLALSSRKLVLETAKFNVITAHSWAEAREAFETFPDVQAVITTIDIDKKGSCNEFAKFVKAQRPQTPVFVLAPNDSHCDFSDAVLSSYEPETLVLFLREKFGDPRNANP